MPLSERFGSFEKIEPSLVAAAFAAFGSGEGMSLVRAIARDDFKTRLTDAEAAKVAAKVNKLMER